MDVPRLLDVLFGLLLDSLLQQADEPDLEADPLTVRMLHECLGLIGTKSTFLMNQTSMWPQR